MRWLTATPLGLPVDPEVRHFTSGYRQRTDGEWADRAEFLDHIGHL
ncbi:nuclear transport factor 2 family protein, partial [Streptomyces goshikiensis]